MLVRPIQIKSLALYIKNNILSLKPADNHHAMHTNISVVYQLQAWVIQDWFYYNCIIEIKTYVSLISHRSFKSYKKKWLWHTKKNLGYAYRVIVTCPMGTWLRTDLDNHKNEKLTKDEKLAYKSFWTVFSREFTKVRLVASVRLVEYQNHKRQK